MNFYKVSIAVLLIALIIFGGYCWIQHSYRRNPLPAVADQRPTSSTAYRQQHLDPDNDENDETCAGDLGCTNTCTNINDARHRECFPPPIRRVKLYRNDPCYLNVQRFRDYLNHETQ